LIDAAENGEFADQWLRRLKRSAAVDFEMTLCR
jgi:hypothetical protein